MDTRANLSVRRISGALAVLALHVAVIAAIVNATRWNDRPPETAREIVLRLVTLQAPKTEAVITRRRKIAVPHATLPYSPPADFLILPATTGTPQTNGSNWQFFDCAPDQLTAATPEQRAACASASLAPRYDPDGIDYRDHTDRSKSAAQWARDRERKNSPLLAPCMSPAHFDPLYTAACLGKTVMTGKYDLEDQPGYQDMPQHAVNEGDTRMAPATH